MATLEPGERPEWSRKVLIAFHGFLLLLFVGGGWLVFGQLRAEPSPAPGEGVASTQDREGVVAGVPSPTLTPSQARSERVDSVPLAFEAV